MSVRPIYVGVGTCDCKRVDVRLYQVPGAKPTPTLMCAKCLAANSYEVPKARTAEDIETVDGELRWKP